jgi:hypothetical protein
MDGGRQERRKKAHKRRGERHPVHGKQKFETRRKGSRCGKERTTATKRTPKRAIQATSNQPDRKRSGTRSGTMVQKR